MISEKQAKSVKKYSDENYDRISLQVPKGQRAIILAHAEKMGDLDVKPRRDGTTYSKPSINAFIKRAIRETIERDLKKMGE